MSSLRPTGAGKAGTALPFLRGQATPRAAIVITGLSNGPVDWPPLPSVDPSSIVGGNLGHALGWTLEVQRKQVLLLNPLGEGYAKTEVPELSVDWLTSVREDGSCALYLDTGGLDAGDDHAVGMASTDHAVGMASTDQAGPMVIRRSAASGSLSGATVRTAIADDYAKVDPVGRNQRCPCGSGKKFKHCHG